MKKRIISAALAAMTALVPVLSGVPDALRTAAAAYAAEDAGLDAVEVSLPETPSAGRSPDPSDCAVNVGRLDSVRWIDMAEKRELTSSDVFQEGHVCSFSAYILAPAGSSWASAPDGRPAVTVTCRAGNSVSEALSVMFNQNPDGTVTLLAVFTFTVAGEDAGTQPGADEGGKTPAGPADPEPGSPDAPEEGTSTASAKVRGALIPAEGRRMQITGFDASPCSVRDAGWFNVTDNQAMETGEAFAAGKDYCLSLFLLPPEGKTWAPDAGVRLVLTDGEEIVPVRSFIQMGGDGVAVLIGDFILTAVTEEEAAAREAEQPGTAPEDGTPAGGGTGEAAPGESASGELPEEGTPADGTGEEIPAAEPSDLTALPGDTVKFHAAPAGGSDGWTCRWIALNGDEIIPLSDGPFGYGSSLSGTSTDTLTVTGAAPEMNGVRFACVFMSPDGQTVSSRQATLTVSGDNQPALFRDISRDDWYYPSVARAVALNLMNGRGGELYEPEGTVTFAEAVKLAAVIRERFETGAVTLENGDPWYASYAEYAAEKWILSADDEWGMLTLNDILRRADEPVTRSEFAWIFARALPAGSLAVVNDIPDGTIPDVRYGEGVTGSIQRVNAVYALFRAGILNGSDEYGTFRPDSQIKRSEVAAITVRMCIPGERVGAPAGLGEAE